ncbi:type IX secretion system membrane protein PorP/SprF [Cellulophaga sp. E16_2]|uniref:PorP/SprF family type IX secretion system membrane protein n=1 Tax=unclassified Cellulophaga TaxID=2634405 RepID=UPI0013FD8239|nr:MULTISPECIES: type IX secretion system membrane protein PorP/SprF [unclassified Cellulophaga]MBO0592845.1 type IX secretion system membrane protein PorP/SprF [Cellulophaga sp. E16_2]
MDAFQLNIKLLLFCLVVPVYMLCAQQPPQYTQYMYNTMVLNSGYTGTSSKIEALLLHRSQWLGIDGAPENQSFSIHGKLKEKIGLGLSATNDNLGAANAIEINGNFAYEIRTGYYTKLSLGINAGVNLLNIDYTKGIYNNQQDPLFQENLSSTRPILGFGAFFYGTNWYTGLSTQNILNSQIFDDSELVTNRKSQYYLMGGYVFDLSERLKFKPTVLTKYVSAAPLTVDVSGNFLIDEKLSLGLAYRYDDAVSALAGFNLSEKFFIGYAYDYTLTDLNNYNDGSHEIILKYNIFDRNKRALSPRFF